MKSEEISLKESWIRRYFRTPHQLSYLEKRKKLIEWEFNMSSFVTCIGSNGLEVKSFGINIEKTVVNHLTAIERLNAKMERLLKRYKYFNCYLEHLDIEVLGALKTKYIHDNKCQTFHDVEEELFEEIQEIEEALSYMYGYPFENDVSEIRLQLNDHNFNDMLEQLGV